MPSIRKLLQREGVGLAADGCVITAGVFALLMGAAFLLERLGVTSLSEPDFASPGWPLALATWLLQVAGYFVGPLFAWTLNGRRLSPRAFLGMALGLIVGGAAVMAVAMTAAGVDRLVNLVTSLEYAGAIAMLVLIVGVFVLVLVRQVAEAVRDLASESPHRALDGARLAAALAVVAFAIGSVLVALRGEGIDASVFMLTAGLSGAVTVLIADIVERAVAGQASGVAST